MASRAPGPTLGSSAAPCWVYRWRRPRDAARTAASLAGELTAAHLPRHLRAGGKELAVADGVLVGIDEAIGDRAQAAVGGSGDGDLPALGRHGKKDDEVDTPGGQGGAHDFADVALRTEVAVVSDVAARCCRIGQIAVGRARRQPAIDGPGPQ